MLPWGMMATTAHRRDLAAEPGIANASPPVLELGGRQKPKRGHETPNAAEQASPRPSCRGFEYDELFFCKNGHVLPQLTHTIVGRTPRRLLVGARCKALN